MRRFITILLILLATISQGQNVCSFSPEYDNTTFCLSGYSNYNDNISANKVVEDVLLKINLKNIEYIEALDDYIKIYIKPYPVLTLMTLKGVMEKLPAQLFARVHRSYIVPLNRIEKFSRNKIQIANGRRSTVCSRVVV